MNRLVIVALVGFAGCSGPRPGPEADRAALLAADRAFAAATAARGLDGWMDAYAADAVRLRLGGSAAEGSVAQGTDAIRAFDAALFEDPAVRLVWDPTDAAPFADGRTGFTTGRASVVRVATADTLYRGTYVTIWRRDGDGWKVILDTGADAGP